MKHLRLNLLGAISPMRTLKRRLLVLALLAAAAGQGVCALEIVEQCDMGSSPSAPNFVADLEESSRVRAALGYDQVCEAMLPLVDLAGIHSATMEGIQGLLVFQPMVLTESLLARYQFLGARPDMGVNRRDRYAALRRFFSGPNGELVELFEWDTSLGGGVIQFGSGWQTTAVRGQPATVAIFQARTGKAVSVVTWERNRRHIALKVNRNINRDGFAEFMRVAESLPDPVPARPDAPPYSPELPPNWPASLPRPTQAPK